MTDLSTPPFDFAAHGHSAAESYRILRPTFERYAQVLRDVLRASIPKDCPIHSFEARAKSIESFEDKASKPNDTDPSKPKYERPLEQITDLAAIRVIAFFPKTLRQVNECIEREFDITWMKDIGEERFAQGRFGYQSIHYLVKLKEGRASLPEYKACNGLIGEIQVRTILQHAWAEMEHDINYKSVEQIPTSIQRRFVALAGMLEIADREFQAIQDEDASLRSAVRASLQDDLTKTTLLPDQTSSDIETTTREPEEAPREVAEALKSLSGWNPIRARALVAAGKYDEAIALYSRMIETHPYLHTLFIGRAKARFLAGDRTGALDDIDTASQRLPNDTSISSLRRQIEEGVVSAPSTNNEAWQLSTSGNELLAGGRGEDAFQLYSKAQELGFSFAFSTFNKAMACALIKDTDGATYFLDQLSLVRGTPMEINILGLRAIVAAIAKSSAMTALRQLRSRVQDMRRFDFNQSPLRHLEQGYIVRDTRPAPAIQVVFGALKDTNGQIE